MGIFRTFLDKLTPSERNVIAPAVEAQLLQNDWSGFRQKATYAEGITRNQDGKPIFNDWSMATAIKDGLKATVWVYACVQKIAASVASVPIVVIDATTGEPLPNSPLQQLLNRPNNFWSRQDFFERLTQHLLVAGNSYVAKNGGTIGNEKIVTELWLLPPDQMMPVPSRTDYLSHYLRVVGGQRKVIPTDEIVQLRISDPGDPYLGMSPMEAAGRTIDTEVEAVTWNKVALQNRAVSDGMISFNHELDDVQYKNMRLRVRQQHMGSRNARAPWVLGNDARWIKMSESAVDMDFINGRKMTREEICAVFGVPPVLVGILDRATYSNYETARRVFWQDTIIPFLANIEDALTLGLAGDGQLIRFDTTTVAVLNEITKELSDTAAKFHSMGVPFNTINERLNLRFPEIPGGDVGYVSASVIPTSLVNVNSFGDDVDIEGNPTKQAAKLDGAMANLSRLLTAGAEDAVIIEATEAMKGAVAEMP